MNSVSICTDQSRYMQSSWMFDATARLDIPTVHASIRRFPENEADQLWELVRRRNVFARHSWENNFYLQRVEALKGHTIVEVTRPGDPDEMIEQAQRVASTVESTALLSVSLRWPREDIQRRLAITTHRRPTLDLTVGRECYYLRSRFRGVEPGRGVTLDSQACRRYTRCGFCSLASLCLGNLPIGCRVATAVRWLVESRQEPLLDAAIVKTAIALETLLVSNESDPLVRVLSERSAFILSPAPSIRERISKIVKRFYAARSGIVHGSRKKASELSPTLLEAVDRLAILVCLIFAANTDRWPSHEELQRWGEGQRWGQPTTDVVTPFPSSYFSNALALAERRAT